MALWASLQDVHCIGLGMIASSKWLYPALTKSHLESEQQKLSNFRVLLLLEGFCCYIQLNFDKKNLTGSVGHRTIHKSEHSYWQRAGFWSLFSH